MMQHVHPVILVTHDSHDVQCCFLAHRISGSARSDTLPARALTGARWDGRRAELISLVLPSCHVDDMSLYQTWELENSVLTPSKGALPRYAKVWDQKDKDISETYFIQRDFTGSLQESQETARAKLFEKFPGQWWVQYISRMGCEMVRNKDMPWDGRVFFPTTQPSEVWSSSCLSLIQHRFVPHRWNGLNHNEMSGIFILPHAATETERHKCIIFDFPHLEANQRRSTPSRVSRPEAMSLWHTDRHRRL